MTWRVVCASAAGTSHLSSNVPCQDSCYASVHCLLNSQPILLVFASDGAGSAINGGGGAEIAIEAAVALASWKIRQGDFGLGDNLATDIVLAVRKEIYSASERAGLTPRDFACTFIGVLSSPIGTLVIQIGDGCVIVDTGTGLELAVIPMSGEYANMTHFVTDDDAVNVFKTRTYPARALKVAVFTDGIQRLAMNMASNTPQAPFFAPFFKGMAESSAENEDLLQGLLAEFLDCQAVNERTDDDKTLALALWLS